MVTLRQAFKMVITSRDGIEVEEYLSWRTYRNSTIVQLCFEVWV